MLYSRSFTCLDLLSDYGIVHRDLCGQATEPKDQYFTSSTHGSSSRQTFDLYLLVERESAIVV